MEKDEVENLGTKLSPEGRTVWVEGGFRLVCISHYRALFNWQKRKLISQSPVILPVLVTVE